MKNGFSRQIALLLVAAALLFPLRSDGTAPPGPSASKDRPKYAGSLNCALCHQTYYKGWVKTFHSTVIQDARKDPSVIMADMNAPDLPFKKKDIHFTIGGHWDQRYLTRIDNEYYVLPRLWSVQSRKWRPYSTYGWQRRPYSRYCVGCHSVGFDPATGEIEEHAVGCESCHGPGSEHIEKPGKTNIVNPKQLSRERSDEICASCHVRGKSLTGEFWFPIGWKPGEKLADYLVPLDKKEGESGHDAIHRLWNKWKSDREAQARARCEVCGIHQTMRPQTEQVSVDSLCTRCHEYQDRIEQHTHHKSSTGIGCIDCHEQKSPDMNESKGNDVHSYWYFLIHPQNCWDKDIYKKCGRCHTDETPKWAYDIFINWKKPVILDH
jgi:hypothetical protein